MAPLSCRFVGWSSPLALVCACSASRCASGLAGEGATLAEPGCPAFLWAFLVWVARGADLNFVALVAESLAYSTPLLYGSMSGMMCERSGVVNIAIEGQFLAGAFLGAMVSSATNNLWLGVAAGAVAGALLAPCSPSWRCATRPTRSLSVSSSSPSAPG